MLAVFLLDSCSNDFLDRYPETAITEGTFWNSENDLITYNNQLYALYYKGKGFGSGWKSAAMLNGDNHSDNSFTDAPDDVRLGINTSNNPGKSDWDWQLIRKVNVFLANYQKTEVDIPVQNKYAAEARLIRALEYYDKVKLYGDLPLIDRVLTEKDDLLFATQESRDKIVQFIMDDLDYAVEWLPESTADNRFNKYVAIAYQARIALHEGTFRKYHGLGRETEFIQKAADAANLIIESGNYTIKTDKSYNSLFATVDLAGNKEVIYYLDYDDELGVFNNVAHIIVSNSGCALSGTKSLVNDYLCTDGLPISESPLYKSDDNITNEFVNRDERLSNTIGLPNTFFLYEKIYLNSSPKPIIKTSCPSGYQVVKFYNEDQYYTQDGKAFLDAPLFRYAEVLLIYAEAKAELGNITQADIDKSIKLLRTKAGVANLILNTATVINDIRRERRVELAFEGFRYDDLMRWKQGSILAQPVLGLKFNPDDIFYYDDFTVGDNIYLDENGYIKSNVTYAFDESKNYYFPIPVNELSLNPKLQQTTGWE